MSLEAFKMPELKGQEFIEVNPTETTSYEKLNELKKTIEAAEQRLDDLQNRKFIKIKQIPIPDLTQRLIVSGRYLLLVPDQNMKSLKLINHDSGIQTLFYTTAIEDLQSLTLDIEITIIGPMRTSSSDIGSPKEFLEGMPIEDFAAVSQETESEISSKTVDGYKYRVTDSVTTYGESELNFESGVIICDPQKLFAIQTTSDYMNEKVVTKKEVYAKKSVILADDGFVMEQPRDVTGVEIQLKKQEVKLSRDYAVAREFVELVYYALIVTALETSEIKFKTVIKISTVIKVVK